MTHLVIHFASNDTVAQHMSNSNDVVFVTRWPVFTGVNDLLIEWQYVVGVMSWWSDLHTVHLVKPEATSTWHVNWNRCTASDAALLYAWWCYSWSCTCCMCFWFSYFADHSSSRQEHWVKERQYSTATLVFHSVYCLSTCCCLLLRCFTTSVTMIIITATIVVDFYFQYSYYFS